MTKSVPYLLPWLLSPRQLNQKTAVSHSPATSGAVIGDPCSEGGHIGCTKGAAIGAGVQHAQSRNHPKHLSSELFKSFQIIFLAPMSFIGHALKYSPCMWTLLRMWALESRCMYWNWNWLVVSSTYRSSRQVQACCTESLVQRDFNRRISYRWFRRPSRQKGWIWTFGWPLVIRAECCDSKRKSAHSLTQTHWFTYSRMLSLSLSLCPPLSLCLFYVCSIVYYTIYFLFLSLTCSAYPHCVISCVGTWLMTGLVSAQCFEYVSTWPCDVHKTKTLNRCNMTDAIWWRMMVIEYEHERSWMMRNVVYRWVVVNGQRNLVSKGQTSVLRRFETYYMTN